MTTPGYNTGGQNISGQFGMPLYGIAGCPKPFTGNYFFVDETNGSDGNTGGPQDPLKTLSQAHSKCTAGNNDVVFFTGSIHITATLAWSKNNTHLIGLCDPVRRGKRARIAVTGTTAFAPLVDVTATGCWFKDFGTFYGFNSASNNTICWYEEGGRNYYDNVEFLGFGDGTASTGTSNITGARALKVGGIGENTFSNCVLGVDTESRAAANYTLEFVTGGTPAVGTPRNHFEHCFFEMYAGAATAAHILIGADGIDRYVKFEDCIFNNAVKSGATTINQVANLNAAIGGLIYVSKSIWLGATHWETSTTNQCYFDAAVYDTSDPGLAANNA